MKFVLISMFLGGSALASDGAFVLGHKMTGIDGKEVDLAAFKGKVILMVNVASKCGLTPQYKDLVALHEKYASQGLVIMGFPANNFMSQEPGSDEEIVKFCVEKYHVGFDMFSKISVKGDDMAPLYKDLTSKDSNGQFGGEITWNFEKFLVGKDGKVIARFEPKTKPSESEVIQAIEAALAQ